MALPRVPIQYFDPLFSRNHPRRERQLWPISPIFPDVVVGPTARMAITPPAEKCKHGPGHFPEGESYFLISKIGISYFRKAACLKTSYLFRPPPFFFKKKEGSTLGIDIRFANTLTCGGSVQGRRPT